MRGPAGEAALQEDMTRARGRLLDSLPLSTPNAQKIEKFLLSQFGVLPSQIKVPPSAHFTTLRKKLALGGAGSGIPGRLEGKWAELAVRLDSIQYLRNAIAHADPRKLETIPQAASNLPDEVVATMWARKRDNSWSLQMPHAVTAVRTTVSVFNTVAFMLFTVTGLWESNQSVLRPPDNVVPFDRN
ncbi:hypothetical protein [Candidatus Spongiisocius sp.]|uniref:hypothetical protein n=1 Tax=Candidatus Spongiisocius sp. TaxID=3101273 RepID=UPI003B5BEEFD